MRIELITAAIAGVIMTGSCLGAEQHALVLPSNMKVLDAQMPDKANCFVGSSAPGQLFLPGEAANITLNLEKGSDAGETKLAIEIREITTRDPDRKVPASESFTDTAGAAPLINVEGKVITHPFSVTFSDKADETVEVKNLPLPERFGTYALVLVRDNQRHFLGTLCRVPKPREGGSVDTAPIFGEGQILDRPELYEARAESYFRMGVRGWRSEISWTENEKGEYDWKRLDQIFAAAEKAHEQVMITLGGSPDWSRPFHEPTPAARWTPQTGGYGGTGDWVLPPALYARYGKWITALCERYHKDASGPLWGIDNYNEPWEGGGISGWARDMIQYRALQKLIAESAHKVSPDIKMLAASSIMNTEDKLYPDGNTEFDKYVDIFTDHYVVPPMCYGPLVAAAHGKQSMETETWFVNSEYLLPQGVAQFMACGQRHLAPWHPRVLWDNVPGTKDEYLIPAPVVAASAAFNYFVTGKTFEKLVFRDHLPWVYQFGKDDDKDALLIVFGQLLPISGDDPKDRLWSQVDNAPGGTITIDNADGLLQFFDLAGNPSHVGEAKVVLPMSIFPTYVKCKDGPVAAAGRIKAAKIDGKRPVEILPHDFTQPIAKKPPVVVELHNCLNREITGKLSAKPEEGIKLESSEQAVKLAAGERKTLQFAVASATASPANAYPVAFHFASDAGEAGYAETMNCLVIPKRTINVDGNLDDWKDMPGVTVRAVKQKVESTELMRRPWLDMKDHEPEGNYAEFKLAWDEHYLYVCARVNDPKQQTVGLAPMAGRDENAYFHSAASDTQSPYKEFLEKHPGHSFAEVPYVYCDSPEKPKNPALPYIPFRRDRIQIALDVAPGWHDLQSDTDRVPEGFHAVPDTDYEYALYPTTQGSELWRMLAPGLPRIHDWPHQPRGQRTTGVVPSAKHVVRREGNAYIYELAIPAEELADMKLAAGTSVGLMLRAAEENGLNIDFGPQKAVTKTNGLTMHPYWERKSNAAVRWTLRE